MSEKKYANLSQDRNVMKPPTEYRTKGSRFGSPLTFGQFSPQKPGEVEIKPISGGASPAGPMNMEARKNLAHQALTKIIQNKSSKPAYLRARELKSDQEKYHW